MSKAKTLLAIVLMASATVAGATDIAWVGDLQGLPTNGVMYCAIIDTNIWFIHVFGYGERPDSALQSVIAAVEARHSRGG